ncbi:MAG: hypothetical protein V4484_16675 [Pseudomonadota bacterium]
MIRSAIRRGDKVAEVIFLVCHTTPVLDRSDIKSTCEKDERRRVVAIKRLAEMGANIDRYLAQNPRWGVFLLEQIGHHEKAP